MTKKSFIKKNNSSLQKRVKKEPKQPKIEELSQPHIKLEHDVSPIPNPPQPINKQTEKEDKDKRIKHNRLIIRNLVFDINEKHLRKLLKPYGEIKEINIPKHPDRNCSKGFAFIEMANRNMCLKAIKELNGTLFKGRNVILDQSVAKQKYMAQKLNDKEDQVQQQQSQQMENQEDNNVKQERMEQQKEEEQQQGEQENEDIKSEQQMNSKQERIAQDHRSQIFIRNLPISVTEQQLLKKFRKYGKIVFVKIVMNKQTNTSKGTAFIKYKDPQVAEKLVFYSRGYEMYMLKKNPHFKIDPTIHLQIDGAIVKIFPVETRNHIQDKLKSRENGEPEVKKKPLKKIKRVEDLIKTDPHGKRKLEFALFGKWRAEQNMNKFDYEKFKAHEKQKVQKLKNPNNSVSSNRLILKYLDKSITQDQIRDVTMRFLTENQKSKSHLTYCKLMLEPNMKKSAGFAFVEFKKDEEAKGFLERLVEKPEQLMNGHFVAEYAIQDSRKLLKLKNSKKINKQEKGDGNRGDGNRGDKSQKGLRNKKFRKSLGNRQKKV